ncbi:MAG: septum site-determining protein MinC [Gammaproteobacteria bacterium]
MSADAAEPGATPCFQLKGSMFTVTVMNILRTDLDQLTQQLRQQVTRAPELFQGMPVVIDLHRIRDSGDSLDLASLALLLSDQGLVPVGVRHCADAERDAARSFGLALLPDSDPARGGRARSESVPAETASAAEPPATDKHGPSRLVTQPVRSGQQIYAPGGDLIILSSVSPGAEVLADGHIHIYGNLHGRALAGVQGDDTARIFCRRMYAELVSVAGIYRVYEDIAEELRGRPVQVFLHDQQLRTDPL